MEPITVQALSERERVKALGRRLCAPLRSGPRRAERLIPVIGWLRCPCGGNQGGTVKQAFAPDRAGAFLRLQRREK